MNCREERCGCWSSGSAIGRCCAATSTPDRPVSLDQRGAPRHSGIFGGAIHRNTVKAWVLQRDLRGDEDGR